MPLGVISAETHIFAIKIEKKNQKQDLFDNEKD